MFAPVIAVLVYIGDFLADLWAVAVEAMPFLSKILPWLAGIVAFIPKVLGRFLSWLNADTVIALAQGTYAMGIRLTCVTAWGVLLAVVTTGIMGLTIRDICFQNPFSGFPEAMMFLVAAAFPIKFGLALMTSYILFRVTVYRATLIMASGIKMMFGV